MGVQRNNDGSCILNQDSHTNCSCPICVPGKQYQVQGELKPYEFGTITYKGTNNLKNIEDKLDIIIESLRNISSKL